ncbi:DUF3466 family protein [Nitrosovibrio sp. Nv6]|uniref:DUF3466 family protein n=1 Tax=Nitrosovibrio sp. Nv6 TaxID=1855340 RepID=UPI0008B5394E|nr:DUF3466 family protein [Nitrosovibrio sp. Nv6]SEO67390.1 PEP-CTERM protein-sorting domain-containing protein [Nitrosovibrio sp. Nv6]
MTFRRIHEIRIFSTLFGAALGGFIFSTPTFAQSYTAFDIGTLGGPGTYATAINEHGQITGNSDLADRSYHAFITEPNGKGITDLGTLAGGNLSWGFDINASGQVVGESDYTNSLGTLYRQAVIVDANGMRGFTGWSYSHASGINNAGQVAGHITAISHSGSDAFVTGPNGENPLPLGSLHANGDAVADINSSGQVVGHAHLSSGLYMHAYITSANGGFASDLGTLGGATSSALAVNDAGKVVGYSEIRTGFESPIHAFITDIDSNMTDLGTLGGASSSAYGINSFGQIVGWADTGIANRRHAFVIGADGEGMTDLNSLVKLEDGIFLSDATDINDLGQIIANASNGRAYLLSPVPEPEAYAMLLAGLGLMGFMARRKQN